MSRKVDALKVLLKKLGGSCEYDSIDEVLEVMGESMFGETTAYGDTLTWDGNTEGLVSIDVLSSYKVSDATPTVAEFQNGMTMIVDTLTGQETTTFTGEEIPGIVDEFSEYAYTIAGNILVSLADNVDSGDDYIIPEKGIYFTKATEEVDGYYSLINSLTINGYKGFETTEVKTIDPKYLPGGSGGGGAMMVNFMYEELNPDDMSFTNVTTDKTHAEIKAHIENGGFAFGKLDMSGFGQNSVMFLPLSKINWKVNENIIFVVSFNGATISASINNADFATCQMVMPE